MIWLFYAANWINQDYLSPQAFGYLFYLTILGLLLTYFRPHGTDLDWGGRLTRRLRTLLRVRAAEVPLPTLSRWPTAAVIMLVVLLYFATVASHQLTPFAILLGVTALVLIGECTARGLPLVMAVILTLWITFVARGYISGHLGHLVAGVGDITQAATANVTARISGSAQHLLVIRERLFLSGGLRLLALLGAARRFRSGHADHAAAALCLAPLLLFGMQAYGGEMLLRIYFFMLPFVASSRRPRSCRAADQHRQCWRACPPRSGTMPPSPPRPHHRGRWRMPGGAVRQRACGLLHPRRAGCDRVRLRAGPARFHVRG
jgi:hypothetical protein